MAATESTTTSPSPEAGSANRRSRRSRQNQESATDGTSRADEQRILVVSGLAHKNERHYGPLADVAGETTLVCLDPTYDIDSANYVRVPEVGPRIVRIVLLLFVALYEGYRNDYDAVASISLVPYGLYALVLKTVYGYPAHLGIIGIDLDYHANQWYGVGPRWAFRQFDVVSVPGPSHADRLARVGVPDERIDLLTNPIDTETYRPPETDIDTDYEFVWVGRFSAEKDPCRFVDALAELDASGREFRAVMVGDGPLRSEVAAKVAACGLADCVDLPGWVDDPLGYYYRSDVFVLTSKRDALPLVMLEAMATQLAPIVPSVGSIPDVVTDGENGIIVRDRDPTTFAAAMECCLDDPDFRRSLAANATAVRSDFSLERASEDWRRILTTL
ncbi:glycosyltransferase [Haloarchaeobius amylolyticus]|uniref:Glycosyltransferase n=1 Tax=Haloarchaeobius amylolyticus TaxID=1198296 RepID=A0ABD6BI18_9EURY